MIKKLPKIQQSKLSQLKNRLERINRINTIYDDIDTYFLMIEEEDEGSFRNN